MGNLRTLADKARAQGFPVLFGVLNVTPDSFSDGGLHFAPEQARARVDALLAEGADALDLGAESSRPGAEPVTPQVQIERLSAALTHARERRAVVSVDTTSGEVARWALANGASLVNDVSCLADTELARAVADASASLILMHARGAMKDMRGFSEVAESSYDNVVACVAREWSAARDRAVAAGVVREEIALDPGLGFWKSATHSLDLVRRLRELEALGAPLFVGPSRKSFLAKVAPAAPAERLGGTIAACLACAERGAFALRVHDVRQVKQALAVHSVLRGGP